MDLNRLRKLAGLLKESIADDSHTNTRIEEILKPYDDEMRVKLRDALDIVKMAGSEGVDIATWRQKLRRIHGDADVRSVTDTAEKVFPFIRKTVAGRYAWVSAGSDEDVQVAPFERAAIEGQIDLTYITMRLIREMGTFSKRDLVRAVEAEVPDVPNQIVGMFVDHLIDQFGATIEPIGGGRYRYKPETKSSVDDTMNLFRDLAKKRDPQ